MIINIVARPLKQAKSKEGVNETRRTCNKNNGDVTPNDFVYQEPINDKERKVTKPNSLQGAFIFRQCLFRTLYYFVTTIFFKSLCYVLLLFIMKF